MANPNKASIMLALIAVIGASTGGTAFLKAHKNPTLKDVFKACEKGTLIGPACCEDMRLVDMTTGNLESCGMVSPHNPDPFKIRKQLEDAFAKSIK